LTRVAYVPHPSNAALALAMWSKIVPSGTPKTKPWGSLGFARDFACGLPLGCARLTPANRLNNRSFGFAQDFACGLPLGCARLTPANRLNFSTT